MEMAPLPMRMGMLMRGNGSRAKSMDRVLGRLPKASTTMGSGKTIRWKAMVY